MCRNIRTLANFEPPATDDEVRASALQFVRKLSGTTRPSRANAAAFEHAVNEVAAAARQLLRSLESSAPRRDREVERRKARARAERRFGEARSTAVGKTGAAAHEAERVSARVPPAVSLD